MKYQWTLAVPMHVEETDERYETYKQQLCEKGFSDTEVWNLDHTICLFILPRLKRFKELSICYPSDLTPEQWNQMLDDMIFAFEWASDPPEAETLTDIEIKKNKERYELGMNHFAERFLDLWW